MSKSCHGYRTSNRSQYIRLNPWCTRRYQILTLLSDDRLLGVAGVNVRRMDVIIRDAVLLGDDEDVPASVLIY